MAKPLLLDAYGGVIERLHHDETADKFSIQTTADVEPIIEANKAAKTSGDGYSPSRELKRIASIPPSVQLLWIERYGVDPLKKGNERLLKRLLNDPEWAHLRTSGGRV